MSPCDPRRRHRTERVGSVGFEQGSQARASCRIEIGPKIIRMAMNRPTPKDQEARFLLEEMFFSTTDARGVITFGNDIFVRVSGYPLVDMVGKPHNIIRHPDMPRAVFRLFWDYLQAGRSVVAYEIGRASCRERV